MFRFILGTVFIAAFSVGALFLSLPAVVGLAGPWAAIISITFVWLLGIASGQLYIEAFLAVPEADHLVSLGRVLTHRPYALFTSVVFLFFSYDALWIFFSSAYEILTALLPHFHTPPYLTPDLCILYMFVLMGCLIYFGQLPTLVAIFLLFLIFLAIFGYDIFKNPPPFFQIKAQTHFYYIFFVIIALFNNSFYQSIMPTVITFLKRSRKKLIYSVWIGFTLGILLFVVLFWLTLEKGIYEKFLAAYESGASAAESFLIFEKIPQLKFIFHFLILIATLFSLLSVAIALRDYFEDAAASLFKTRKRLKRLFFVLLIFLPPLLTAIWTGMRIVEANLLYTGVVALLVSEYLLATILPLSWVWALRYNLALPVKPILWGGKKMMIVMAFATLILFFVLGMVTIHKIAW
jgi:amino acid permease